MDIEEFRQDLLNQANARASVDGIFTADAFMAEAADLLIDAGEVDSLDLAVLHRHGPTSAVARCERIPT